MIKKSDGWTSGVTGSAGVSTGDPDGGAGNLEQGQCDGGTVKIGDGGAGYARLDECVHVEEVGGSEVGGAESEGVSAVDLDGGAGTLVQGHSDDGRVKNCAAHDDTKSSVESEVTQSWRVCSPGGDESAGAGAGPPGVSTEGSTQEQGSQDTDLLMKQNTLNPRLFLAVWPVVNRWIREGLEAEADRRGSRSILRRCWLVWAQDILPPPLVSSSDSEVGLWRGTPRRPREEGIGQPRSASDSESDSHGVSVQMLTTLVVMKCFRSPASMRTP